VPHPDELACGDDYLVEMPPGGRHAVAMVVDGPGHGRAAAGVAQRAVHAVRERVRAGQLSPAALVAELQQARSLAPGTSIAITLLDDREIQFAGAGTINATIVSAGGTQAMITAGAVGAPSGSGRVEQLTYPFPYGARMVMTSVGISRSWSLERYAGALRRHPSVAAGLVYRDHRRGRDDATVLVLAVDPT
jgi:hypothetical protein